MKPKFPSSGPQRWTSPRHMSSSVPLPFKQKRERERKIYSNLIDILSIVHLWDRECRKCAKHTFMEISKVLSKSISDKLSRNALRCERVIFSLIQLFFGRFGRLCSNRDRSAPFVLTCPHKSSFPWQYHRSDLYNNTQTTGLFSPGRELTGDCLCDNENSKNHTPSWISSLLAVYSLFIGSQKNERSICSRNG